MAIGLPEVVFSTFSHWLEITIKPLIITVSPELGRTEQTVLLPEPSLELVQHLWCPPAPRFISAHNLVSSGLLSSPNIDGRNSEAKETFVIAKSFR